MRRWPSIAAFVLVFAATAAAHAGPAPYTDWAFDVRRANEAGDTARLAELTRAQPDFARIWFYGQVLDLVTVGITDPVKNALRPRLKTIADTLADLEPPDERPRLYLDWSSTGILAELAPKARELQDQWINGVRAEQPLPARLAAAQHPEAALPVYFQLFFRAELASRRLGGDREKALLLRVARRMAEGFALAAGDVVPWRTLSGYFGQAGGVPLAGEGVVEAQVGGALNAYLAGDLARSRAGLDTALATSRQARSGSIFVALVMNGAAHAAGWLGDHATERALRVRVLQAVRPLEIPNVVALVADQMVRAHLADQSIDDMVAYTREMREMGDVVMRTGRHLRTMELAATALVQTATRRYEQGKLADAERVIEEARALMAALIEDEAIKITTPSEQAVQAKRDRQTDRIELDRLVGRIAERRGRFDQARVAYGQVRTAYEGTVPDPARRARSDLELARVLTAAGDVPGALRHCAQAAEALGQSGPPELRAELMLRRGHGQLLQGNHAAAFANANAGLSLLREAGVADAQKAVRAELHVLAAAALDGAGMTEHVAARLGHALELAPADARIARITAVARAEAGDVDGARAALEPIAAGLNGREARVLQNCVLVRAGRGAEAAPALKVLVPQLTLPHLRRAQIIGRTCLAAARLEAGDVRGANAALRPTVALVLEYPDPMLMWRVYALGGQIAAAKGLDLDAAAAWRQALDRLMDAGGEQPARGATVDVRTLALPADASMFAEALVGALVVSARVDRGNADTHHRAALNTARWSALRAASPTSRTLAGIQAHPEADRGTRAGLLRLATLRAVLADPAVVTAERVAATQAMRKAASDLRTASGALAATAPRFADYYSPSPRPVEVAPDEALVWYRVEAERTHLWIVRSGQPVKYFGLPGRDGLAAALAPAVAVLSEAPTDWAPQTRRVRDPNAADWKALAKAGRTILPFAWDKALAAELAELKLRVVADGPLVRFPLGALLVADPPRTADGSAPAFFGARFDFSHALPPQAAGEARQAELAVGMFGPLAAAAAGCPVPDCIGAALAGGFDGPLRPLKGFTVVRGAETASPGLLTALMGSETLIVASPVDLAGGAFVTSPDASQTGVATYARLGGEALADGRAAADSLLLLRPVGADADGWRRLGAALTAAGVQSVIMPAEPFSGDFGRLAERLAIETPIRAAVHGEQRDAMVAKVDPAAGGRAAHHPYYWARWVVYGAPMDRASLDAAVKPLPPPMADPFADGAPGTTPSAAPADPYGDTPPPAKAAPADPYGNP